MDKPHDIFERLIEVLLTAMLLFMPLAFGVVDAWSELIVVWLAAAIAICFVLRWMVCRDTMIVRSWVYLPIAVFLLLIVIQLVPLPVSLVEMIASGTAGIKHRLLRDVPNAGSVLANMTLTFYPQATMHDLRLVLAVIAVFVVVLNTYDRPAMIRRLLGTIAAIGGGIAILAIAQVVTRTDKIYWLIPIPIGRSIAESGPFLNHSHFGQFMNLSLGATIAWIMVELRERFGHRVTPSEVIDYLSSPQSKLLWLFIAFVVLGMTSIFTSLTRGGIISMLIAGSLTTLLVSVRGSVKFRGQIMAVMALAAFVCVLYIGFDATYERLATLRDVNRAEGGRWQIVKDIASAWTRFPVFGTGLGTHAVVYPMFGRSMSPALFSHAENEYAQTIEETGILGLGFLVAFAVIVWAAYVRVVRRHDGLPIHAAVYGLGFGLLGIMIHSFTDFGQHLPSNAVLSAICCALVVRLDHLDDQYASPVAKVVPASGGRRWALGSSILLFLSLAAVWGVIGANRARAAEVDWKNARRIENALMQQGWQGTSEQYIDLITHAAAAAEYQPCDVHYRHWLNVYRWRSLSHTSDPNSGGIVLVPEAIGFTRQIVDELHQTRILCPTYGATWCLLGQLEAIVLNDNRGKEHIRQGYELAPCDPIACLIAGSMDAAEGKRGEAFAKFARAIELDERLFQEAAIACIQDLNDPNMAVILAGDDVGRLRMVADLLASMSMNQSASISREIRDKIVYQLSVKARQKDAPAGVFASLANIQRSQGDIQAAVDNYQRALVLDYGQVNWRYNLAMCLAEQRQITNAIREARICLRLRPDFKPAKQMIAELSVQPQGVENVTEAGEETRRL